MTDMLVPLFSLPEMERAHTALKSKGISIHHAMAHQRSDVLSWVEKHFSRQWADEARLAFNAHPVGCYVAVCNTQLHGFVCINCTYLGFLGPIGVTRESQGIGIGRVLLLAGLYGLQSQGYAYGIIGCVSDPDFFKYITGAWVIPDSTPGPYFSLGVYYNSA